MSEESLVAHSRRLLDLLQHRPRNLGQGPISASTLATHLDLRQTPERQRRIVREIVRYCRSPLRAEICANHDGYWLARCAAEWAEYREARKRGLAVQYRDLYVLDQGLRDKRAGQLEMGDWGSGGGRRRARQPA